MTTGTRHAVKFRRRREGATNYKKRIKILQARLPRLVVRKSSKYISAQIVEFSQKGDKTILTAHSSELRGFGWKFGTKNIPAAYLTGLLVGKKAQSKKVANTVADIGLYSPTKGAKVFATIKGAADAGLKIAHSAEKIPPESKITGKHLSEYLKKADLTQNFEQVKKKILTD